VRWPGKVRAGVRDDRLAATVDIAPTIYDAAGVKRANRPELDGRSLLRSWDRNRLVLESWAWHGRPQWAATRTRHDLFVEYYEKDTVVARELYDLEKDPFGERNLLADGGEDAHDVGWRSALLERDKKCSRERCP
jgi:arylsulfatase A-like enzyme